MTIRITAILSCAAALAASATTFGDTCDHTARLQKRSARLELTADLKLGIATCLNLTDPGDRAECLADSLIEYAEGFVLSHEQYQARLSLCDKLGGGAYDPEIDPEDFVCDIDNPYLPLPVGAEWVYRSETDEGLETIVVTVLEETREILGVECVTVRDVVTLEGEVIEDTLDWYAQDEDGNVWYFGEISFSYEDDYVASIEGSWLAGVDGAKPGIVMLANPRVNTTYRQEWLLDEAEDAATVLDVDATVCIDLGTFHHCVKTEDFLPPEPSAVEHKYYAPRIGFIYETKVDSDETLELVEFRRGN